MRTEIARRDRTVSNARRSFSVEFFGGSFWFVGWLFTIGFVELTFWKAVLGLVIWPYFLGASLR
jgi:hypothetical protein